MLAGKDWKDFQSCYLKYRYILYRPGPGIENSIPNWKHCSVLIVQETTRINGYEDDNGESFFHRNVSLKGMWVPQGCEMGSTSFRAHFKNTTITRQIFRNNSIFVFKIQNIFFSKSSKESKVAQSFRSWNVQACSWRELPKCNTVQS
jgi:hypothetical protein